MDVDVDIVCTAEVNSPIISCHQHYADIPLRVRGRVNCCVCKLSNRAGKRRWCAQPQHAPLSQTFTTTKMHGCHRVKKKFEGSDIGASKILNVQHIWGPHELLH